MDIEAATQKELPLSVDANEGASSNLAEQVAVETARSLKLDAGISADEEQALLLTAVDAAQNSLQQRHQESLGLEREQSNRAGEQQPKEQIDNERQLLDNVDAVDIEEQAVEVEEIDATEIQRRKIEVILWMQEWLKQDNIVVLKADSGTSQETLAAELNLHDTLKTGSVLCKLLNRIMLTNPSFTEANLPPIQINERTDLFASLSNLSNFVRTAELYFNVDRFRLFEPINVLKTQDETPFVLALYFLKLVVDQLSTNVPVLTAKPYAALTFDQLSTLVTMITAKQSAPVVAYDPRVVMSVQDTEVFQKLIAKMEALESTNKTLAMLTTSMSSKFDKLERGQTEIRNTLDAVVGGVLGAFEDISNRLRELKEVTDAVNASAVGLQNMASQLDSYSQTRSTSNLQSMETLHFQTQSSRDKRLSAPVDDSLKNGMMQNRSGTRASPSVSSFQSISGSQSQPSSKPSILPQNAAPKVFKLPDEVLAKGLPKEEIMRQSILYEVIESEADYVRDLNQMADGHRRMLKEQGILDDTQLKIMFSNLDDLLTVNRELLRLLTARKEENALIEGLGDVFLTVVDRFTVYDGYCSNYPLANHLLKDLKQRDDMKAYLDRTINSSEFRGLSLESFLIKPVQRICKYPLLFRELIKNTPKDHKDRLPLEQCQQKIEEVVTLVNERSRAAGDREKLFDLQNKIDITPPLDLIHTSRKLLKEGPIQRIVLNKVKDRQIYLFNDILLICKQHAITKGKLQLEAILDLKQSVLNPSVNPKVIGTAKMIKTSFEIYSSGESFIFNAPSEADRMKWLNLFEDTLNAVYESPEADFTKETIAAARQSTTRPASAPEGVASAVPKPLQMGKDPTGSIKRAGTLMKKRFTRRKSIDDLAEGGSDTQMDSPTRDDQSVQNYGIQPNSSNPLHRGSVGTLATVNTDHQAVPDRRGSAGSNQSSVIGNTATSNVPQQPTTAEISGFPQWRAVDAGNGVVYYYNTETLDTSWFHPSVLVAIQDSNLDAAELQNLKPEERQRLYQQKLDYMQKLQEQLLVTAAQAQSIQDGQIHTNNEQPQQ